MRRLGLRARAASAAALPRSFRHHHGHGESVREAAAGVSRVAVPPAAVAPPQKTAQLDLRIVVKMGRRNGRCQDSCRIEPPPKCRNETRRLDSSSSMT